MPFKSEKQRKWMWANDPKMAKKWEKKEKMKKERVKELIKKMVREIMAEDFAGAYPKSMRKKFDKGRQKQSEVLGYKLTGHPDVKTEIDDATKHSNGIDEAKKRDYKAEYKKYGSSTKAKKYRAELNKYNRQKGTYGNGDGLDASHKNGKIVGFEEQSKNRGRAEKSRLKKEGKLKEGRFKLSGNSEMQWGGNKIVIMTGHGKIALDKKELKNMLKGLRMHRLADGKINEATETIFDVAARVMKDKQAYKYKSRKGQVMVDMQSANLLMKVFKKVSTKMKKVLTDLGEKNPTQLMNTLWAVVK